jgi:hypothetical protein
VPVSRLSSKLSVGLLASACALAAPSAAEAFSPFLVTPDPAVAEASPAYRYANMTDAEALAELDVRKIAYTKVDSAPGVRAPIRLAGRLHGVYVHSSVPLDQRATTPYEILDARLALALDDFCALLERHDIDEVVHYTMYRPNVAMPDHGATDDAPQAASKAPGARPRPQPLGAKGTLDNTKGASRSPAGVKQKSDDGAPKPDPGMVQAPAKKPIAKPAPQKPAAPPKASAPAKPIAITGKRQARRDPIGTGMSRTTWAPPGTRHPAGLAIDVALVHKKDGRWLSVQRDFHGKIGAKTCGDDVPVPEVPEARELRALVCESQQQSIFTYVLTPDFNAAHHDHFHMEVKPGVKWFLYH